MGYFKFTFVVGVCACVALTFISVNAGASTDLGRTAPPGSTSGTTCVLTTNCTYFQAADDGVEGYAAPSRGVITSYTTRTGSAFPGINAVGLRVFRPMPGGAWLLSAASAFDTTLFAPGDTLVTIATRTPVESGDRIGLAVEFDGDTAWQYGTLSAADEVRQVTSLAPVVGSVVTPANLTAYPNIRMNLRVHLEIDADTDGYGDDSQDLCPLDPLTQSPPCTPPVAADLRFTPRRFHVNRSGAVVKTATRAGSSLIFALSQPADLTFVVSRRLTGRRDGRKCVPVTRANSLRKRCVRYRGVHHWTRAGLPSGSNSLKYSGRYKHGRGNAILQPGRYRLTATPGNASGTGPVTISSFTVTSR